MQLTHHTQPLRATDEPIQLTLFSFECTDWLLLDQSFQKLNEACSVELFTEQSCGKRIIEQLELQFISVYLRQAINADFGSRMRMGIEERVRGGKMRWMSTACRTD